LRWNRKILNQSNNLNSNFISAEDLRPLWKFFGKNWWLLVLLPLIGLLISFWYTSRVPRVSSAKTEILLKSDETYNYQSELRSNFGYFSQYADLENQKRILSSYDLVDKTISKLNLSIAYYYQGRIKKERTTPFPAFKINADLSKVNRKILNQPLEFVLLSPFEIELSYAWGEELVKVTHRLDGDLGKVDRRLEGISISGSAALDDSSISQFQETLYIIEVHPNNRINRDFRNALRVENVAYTSILTLICTHEVPAYAKMFLDSLSQEYLGYSLEKQYKVNENTQKYIELQLSELEVIMDSLEYAIELYKSRENIIDLDKEENYLFQNLLSLEEDKARLENVAKTFEQLEFFVKSPNNQGELPPSFYIYNEDGLLKQQVIELYEMRKVRADMLADFKESTFSVKRQDSLITTQSDHILTYLQNSSKAVLDDIKIKRSEIKKISNQLFGIPRSQRALLEIKRKLKVNESLYVYLLESRASTVISKAAILPEMSIIESARGLGLVPIDSSPHYILGFGIGLFLASMIGLFRSLVYERIESVAELKSISSIPVLGSIPHYEEINQEPIAILGNSRSNTSEAFRALRTNLQYLLSKENGNVIMISSLHPSEGKTFTSSNMASMLAKAGKKTVLIDFDLHKPKVHKTFDLGNNKGTSSILAQRREFSECIHKIGIENLDVVTAGPVPPNASELILNDRTQELIASLKKSYDYVIIDTPPLMLISDSLVLHNNVDNSIFVMNTEKAKKAGVRFLEETLEQNEIQNVSLILNNIKLKKWQKIYAKYGYRYGYSYGYRYGYGYSYGGYYNEEVKKKRKKK